MNLLVRLFFIYWHALRQPRGGLLECYKVECTVLPTDLDIFFHMNNGRYFSIMDLGRVDLFVRTGLLKAIKKAGLSVTVACEALRFRRSLTLFQRFMLETHILGWDEKSIYLEQRFLRPAKNGTWDLAAHGAVRARIISPGNAKPSTAFLEAFGAEFAKSPPLPAWVVDWLEMSAGDQMAAAVPKPCRGEICGG